MLGIELVELRKAAEYKAYQLATVLDINPATLSRYERGRAPVPKLVEFAVRYLCEPSLAPNTAEQRLITAIKEVANA